MQINNNGLNFDNTNRVHILAECMDIIGTWDKAPSGKEKQLFKVGDKIESLESDVLKAGTISTIKQFNVDNGYYHYYAGGVWHRQKDIKKV